MTTVKKTRHWNIPWLAGLPGHWEVVPSKRLFAARRELTRPGDEQLAATQAYGVILQKEYERRIGRRVVQITQNLDKRRHVEKDDFIISMRSFEGGLERAWATGCIRSSYVVLKPSAEVNADYFKHLFKSHGYIQALRATSNFIRDGQDLNMSNFSLVDLPLPPPNEQRLIARYLDHIDHNVRRVVRAKKALIGLLNEQKQAIIHRAVTRGLDPNAKLKPSGIPWLGDVPEGWGVIKLARIVRSSNAGEVIDKGWWGRGDEDLYTCARNILKSDYVSFPERKRTTGRDLLLTRNGTPYVHRPVPNAIYSNVVQRINLVEGANREYVALALEVAARSMKGYGVSIESLNYDMWKVLTLLSPSPQEQSEIVAYVAAETETANAGIDLVEREISLIQEFRTRIVADVVTGKLDVRALATTLPETAGQEMAFDLAEDEDLDDLPEDSDTEEAAA